MKTLVVAATLAELSPLYAHLGLPGDSFIQTPDFDVLITGVGMTATAFSLGRYLNDTYNLVLNLGIAGSFDRNIALGTVLNITRDVFAELGAEDNNEFLSIDQMGFGKGLFIPLKSTIIPEKGVTALLVNQLKEVTGITVNKVHGNTKSISEVFERLQPDTESMEGAAVFYCCDQMGLPALQIRSVSNYVEQRNRENWKIGLAIKNLNQWAIDFLTNS
jgi:futalosine hydrolase